jgi:hypothetical protein
MGFDPVKEAKKIAAKAEAEAKKIAAEAVIAAQ